MKKYLNTRILKLLPLKNALSKRSLYVIIAEEAKIKDIYELSFKNQYL